MSFFADLTRFKHQSDDMDEDYYDDEVVTSQQPDIDPQESRSILTNHHTTNTSSNKVVSFAPQSQEKTKVVLVSPEEFETASEIADHLRETRTVVLNLEKASKETRRRLIDFLSGVAYATDGTIKRAAVSTYIITPKNVELVNTAGSDVDYSHIART